MQEVLEKGQRELEKLTEREGDVRWVLRLGGVAVVLFLIPALVGLWALSVPPYTDLSSVAYAPTQEWIDWILGSLFLFGLLFTVLFAGSFSRITAQYIKVKASTSREEEEVRLVSGK